MFEKLLTQIAKTFDQHQIPYMVIGGQALLQYGQPRLTEDIDITLGLDCKNYLTILNIIQSMQLKPFDEANEAFIQKTNVLPCLDQKTGIRIDFIFSFLPYEKQAIERAQKIKLGETKVSFASAEDLIVHKMFAGRPRDLEDVKSILIKQEKSLNLNLIKETLQEFSKLEGYQSILIDFNQLLKEIK